MEETTVKPGMMQVTIPKVTEHGGYLGALITINISNECPKCLGIKCEVISLPVRSDEGYWTWQSKNMISGKIIDYGVSENHPSYYAVNLYDYEAYQVKHYI